MVGLLAVAISLGGILGVKFLAVMAVYCSVSLLYSFFIKRIAILDVVTLAGLYAWRLVAGGVATGITLSNWLLAFALFIFVSLATLKRFVELEEMQTTDSRNKKKAHGRGYVAGDIQLIFAMGVAAAMVSVLVVILYVASPEVAILYSYPEALLFLAPLMLIWVARVWLLALRHELHDDPVLFAVKDTFSYMIAGLMLGTVILGKLLIR
jgi:4-hydroxybenzoate polyprenyltransferase